MGDWFQTVVDRDVGPDEAEALALQVRQWLVERGIVGPAATDCVLGADEGYPPGPNFLLAIDGPDHRLREMSVNGLQIVVGRTVFDSGQGDIRIDCPGCGKAIDDSDALEEGGRAIGEWYDGEEGMLRCPHCGGEAPVTECLFDPPWGFGNLGFQFWNWPPLHKTFVVELTERLGHRTVLVEGKL